GAGGIITNTAGGSPVDFHAIQTSAFPFSGQIQGNLNLLRSGETGTILWPLNDNNSYTGSTTLMGGITQLIDQGRMSGTSGISINNAILQWNDSGIQAMNNRLTTGALAVTNANSANI